MRNVMVRCLFSVLILVLSHEFQTNAQERHALQWAEQQLDDWQPFIPNFAQERPYQQYPRSDTVRQFFGKNVEAVHNSLKKSFQASAANNVDQYAVPPVLNTFNSFGLQTRPAILDKNIKDSQFLEQSSHFPLVKYQHQPLQQAQIHRFPAYIPPPAPQYQTINQYPAYQPQSQFSNRFESGIKQQSLLQAPARTISTSVQVFPPNQNQQNHYPSNGAATFFLPPSKNENFLEEEPPVRKQSRPNDFLISGNIPTIYGTKDPALNIAPPLKAAPFVRPEIQNHFLYEPVKAIPERFEIGNYPKQGQHEVVLAPAKHLEHKLVDDQPKQVQLNPSKQVFEQLSHYGRPFTLPKESTTEYSRLKPEKHSEPEGLIHSYSPPASQHHYHHHHKKEKVKPTHHYMPLKSRIPASNVAADANYPVTSENLLVDYEPGKLQGVKTVTYTPDKEVIHFNEGDVSGHPYQTSEKIVDATPSPFLPTPTEPDDGGPAFIHFEKYTTPSEELVSKLPQNHKYSGSRNRFHLGSHTTESSIQYIDDRRQPTTQPTARDTEDRYQQYETSTRKSSSRRRKPSKNKNKEYIRQKVNVYTEPSTDIYSSAESTTEANYPSTRKKSKHTTTTEAAEENYPNYPNYPNFANFPAATKQTPNYPKEYQYDQYTPPQTQYTPDQYQPLQTQYSQDQYQPSQTQYTQNSPNEEEKENYPVFSVATTTRAPETTTTPSTPSTSSLRPRIKPKYGNNSTRPRFSIKEYKRTTTAASVSSSTPSTTENLVDFESEKKNNRKNLFASRLKTRTESTSTEKEDSSTVEPSRKYKPRVRPSKYKSSTTTAAPETTSERVNTFKPSTVARYRPSSTSKYFNRIRTTTEIVTNEAEDAAPAASDRKPVRTMLYSAKRSSILKSKLSTTTPKVQEYEDDEEDEYLENEAEESTSAATSLKKNFQKYKTAAASKLEKADDVSETSIMTSSEEDSEKEKLKGGHSEASKDAAVAGSSLATGVGASGAGDDFSYQDEVMELHHDTEATTAAPSSSTSKVSAVTAEERIDDDEGDRVSQVSSLTSIIDNSKLPAHFYRKWSSTGNQNE